MNFQLEVHLTQWEILGIKYKCNYPPVFAQGQVSPVGQFSSRSDKSPLGLERHFPLQLAGKKKTPSRMLSVLQLECILLQF